jgi:GST-like protein
MFIASGLGPFAGQAVHFKSFAAEPMPYALNRYMFEAERHFKDPRRTAWPPSLYVG